MSPPSNPPPLGDGGPDSCVSLASILRCFYSQPGDEIHHVLLIIPVLLELIFSVSLIFTNWRSGRRHLLLVVEGLVTFLLSLIEVLSFEVPAARSDVLVFKSIDQSIGALSFIQLLFYMLFLYAWVRGECLPVVPSRLRRIVRLLLLSFIPVIITMNTIASFAGISYVQGPQHIVANFAGRNDRFVWTFFSSITLALLTLFQASCFCFAFYRFMRALIIQRNIETDSKDAIVFFKGIGWINGGIKFGAIETVIGFVFSNGVAIAYVRRGIRMLSRALLSIGVAKGIDATEDFKVIRDELESNSSERGHRQSRLHQLISNPRFSTFRQLSPTATAFHATPRAPPLTFYNIAKATSDDRPHPYASSGFLAAERTQPSASRNNPYTRSPPIDDGRLELPTTPRSGFSARGFDVSPKLTTTKGLPGMTEFAQIKAKRMSQHSPKRVTVYYYHGTPTLHLRLSTLDLPSPAAVVESIKSPPTDEIVEEHRKSPMWANSQMRERSRFSATTRGSTIYDRYQDEISVYPASTTHGHPVESGNVYRREPIPYGHTSSPSQYFSPRISSEKNHLPTISAAHGHSPNTSFEKLEPPVPAYLDTSTRRSSGNSEASGFSAAQAEIIDTPRRKLSFTKHKSALARAVLYPVPGTKVVMALAGSENEDISSSATSQRRLRKPNPTTSKIAYPTLPTSQRPSPSPPPIRQSLILASLQAPRAHPHQPMQQEQEFFTRESIIDEDGNVITVTAIAPPIEEDYDSDSRPKRGTRALSGYSVRSVPETLQAVRELAKQFPGPPLGAVVANIGIRASAMGDRDDISSREDSGNGSVGHRMVSMGSTDTEEIMRKRIPAEAKMKGKMIWQAPLDPLPPLPGQQMQQLPPPLPRRNPQRLQPKISQPAHQRIPPARFIAKPIDPFDDDETTSYPGTANELSPLSMSIRLRHPQSFVSTMYPSSTRHHSEMMTELTSPVTSPSCYSPGATQESAISPGIIDFDTALREWNADGQRKPGSRPMADLPDIAMIEGHRRSLSVQTPAEFERKQWRQPRPTSVATSDLEYFDELPDQLQQLRQSTGAPLNRIKSIGKVPRRITPQPTRSGVVRGSLHLQHLVIPDSSSSNRDVPISAVGAGGAQTILGVDKAGMNVAIRQGQEQDDPDTILSATTEGRTSSNGRGGGARFSEVLSIEDGGYVPIRLQGGSRKGFY